MSNAVSLKSDTKGIYDFDLSASSYNYLQDILLNPFTRPADRSSDFPRTGRSRATTAPTGRTPTPKDLAAIRLSTARKKSASESTATAIISTIRFTPRRSGMHRHSPAPARFIPTASAKPGPARCGCKMPGRFVPNWKLTLGGRLETWQALDGYNVNTTRKLGAGVITSTDGGESAAAEFDQFFARRHRCLTIRTRTGTSPRISARPTAIRR